MEKLSRSFRNLFATSLFAVALAPAAGCEGTAVTVGGAGEAFNRSGQLLSIGNVIEINGTYGSGCLDRSGQWSVATSTLTAPSYQLLDVVRANSACTLTLDSLRIGTSEATAALYIADSPIPLGNSFLPAGSAFRMNAAGAVALFANARVQPDLSFNSNFMVQTIFSADSGAVSANVSANFEVVSSTAVANGVPAPDYGADVTGINLQVDATYQVTAAAGAVMLLDMMQPGDSYVISTMDFGVTPAYGDVAMAFDAGAPVMISQPNQTIPAAAFSLVGESLASPLLRSIILMHEDNGVRSYEVVAIRFLGPN